MDSSRFCGEKGSKKKAKEKYKEEVDKETNEVTVHVQKETQIPESAGNGHKMGTISETCMQVSQETGDLSPHIAPSGVGDQVSLDFNIKQDKMPNQSSNGHNNLMQKSHVTHAVKEQKSQKPPKKPYYGEESSVSATDSSSDSTSNESSPADDSDDSPVERRKSSKTMTKSRQNINAQGGIVDMGKYNRNKVVHVHSRGDKKKRNNKGKDRSSKDHEKGKLGKKSI